MAQKKKLKGEEYEKNDEAYIVCTHCNRKIFTAKLIGMSLVCPYCNKPCDELYIEEIVPINGVSIS
jgi:uncharacterized CHY-type Zn-finger protein